jgi:hypothetical protein
VISFEGPNSPQHFSLLIEEMEAEGVEVKVGKGVEEGVGMVVSEG